MFKRSLDIRENDLEPNHPDVALALSNLAEAYRKQAKYSESERLNQRALEVRRNSEDADPAGRSTHHPALCAKKQSQENQAACL